MAQPETVHGPWVGATAVLFLILVGTGMFYYQYYIIPATLGPKREPQNIVINLVAEQFSFMVNGTMDIRSTPIAVHVGDNVTFRIHATFQKETSFNQHGFFIQGLMEIPVTVPASQDVIVNVVPDQPGEYAIICTIFCGAGHGNMRGLLQVLP